MGSAEPPPVTSPLCQSRSGGNDGVGEIVRSGGCRRKTRFSEQQVRSLECLFEAQATLEPRRKAELAGELGLHPRHVTVWFQNRRARHKSKQLEREYTALRADYEALLSSFDSLKKETQSLAAQLTKLAETLEKPMEERSDGGEYLKRGAKDEESREPSWLSTEGRDLQLMVCSGEEELVRDPEGPERCCFDDAAGFSDLCCGGSSLGWWEVWPLDE